MHIGMLAGFASALRLIGPGAGTPIGTLTSGGGLARAFTDPPSPTASVWSDGANSAYTAYGATPGEGFIGLVLPGPAPIRGFKAWSSGSGWDQASQGAVITHELQASNDTSTGLDGTWLSLHTSNVDDVWGSQDVRDVLFAAPTAFFRAYRLRLTGTYGSGGQGFQCNGLRFYVTTWI
jgi:hypothetical protein